MCQSGSGVLDLRRYQVNHGESSSTRTWLDNPLHFEKVLRDVSQSSIRYVGGTPVHGLYSGGGLSRESMHSTVLVHATEFKTNACVEVCGIYLKTHFTYFFAVNNLTSRCSALK